jgi:hypothetical protein
MSKQLALDFKGSQQATKIACQKEKSITLEGRHTVLAQHLQVQPDVASQP